jgi:nucleotide-binding universal stress UspA family protein
MTPTEHRRVVAGVGPTGYRAPMLRWAAAEALARDAELRLVTAVPRGVPPEATSLADATARLADEYPGLALTTAAACGAPADVLRHASAEADLLVVGADDGTPFAEAISGSVPGALLTTAPCPFAVVPHTGSHAGAGAPVVAAVDDAGVSQAALAYAFATADRSGRPLVLLHSRPPDAADRSLALTGFRGLYPDVRFTETVAPGDLRTTLADWSRTAALLILGSRRPTAPAFGSAQRTLLRHSACPVVITRPPACAGRPG